MRICIFVILSFININNVLAFGYSQTLPVMFIQTEDNKPILTKTEYINATYYIDPMGIEGIDPIGSVLNPLPLQIRGRGNFTWGYFDKKPYRIKLEKKQALLGMKKSKHFALLAHADNDYAFFRNTVAFELSKRLDMPYTPAQQPLEVVLNGDYIGLYFLTETIRVDADRVNITEQLDGETNEELISGGWLVEIDNNKDANQIELTVDGTDLEWLWITYHSPEILSDEQKDYLYHQFESIKQAIYVKDKQSTKWEELIDITSLAKYYIIHEIVDQLEGFLGSCYLYKNIKETKWKFGPVWDFGNAFNKYHSKDKFIYQDSPFPASIINEIVKFPNFQKEVRLLWNKYYPEKLLGLNDFIREFTQLINSAAVCDAQRWPEYGDADVSSSSDEVISSLNSKMSWLDKQFSSANNINVAYNMDRGYSLYYDMWGRCVRNPQSKHLYLMKVYQPNGSVKVRKIVIP